MSKAFDRIVHDVLINKLDGMGFSVNLLQLLNSYLCDRQLHVVINGFMSKGFKQISGVPQGSNLGPLLFLLYVNDAVHTIRYAKCLLYADDLKIFHKVKSIDDCCNIQNDLTSFSDWCIVNGLSLNTSKCKVVHFTRNFNKIEYNYRIGNNFIDKCGSFKDLGVIFDNKLNFTEHLTNITSSALKNLGFIVRNTKSFTDTNSLRSLYASLVRPKLEYCSIVWSPFYQYKINSIENVQRRFLK